MADDESSEEGYVEVRSRRKKKAKKLHRTRPRSPSATTASSSSDSEGDEGNTKDFAQKKFLSKGIRGLIGVKTIEKAVNDKSNPSPALKHVRIMAKKVTKKMPFVNGRTKRVFPGT